MRPTVYFAGFSVAAAAAATVALATGGCTQATDNPWRSADADELRMQIQFHQEPSTPDVVHCHYFKAPNEAQVEIDRLNVDFPQGSHHVHIYRSDIPHADGVEDCSAGIDWTVWSLLFGVQTQPLDWQLPPGVTVPLQPHQQILVQVHWLNFSDHAIDPTIQLNFHRVYHSTAHLGVIFGVAKDVYLNPGQRKTVAGWTPTLPGAELVAVMGHFHGRGRHYSVDVRKSGEAPGAVIYEAQDEQTFEFRSYAPGERVFQEGEGLAFNCDFFNDTTAPLTWGPNTQRQEHCNMAVYYYPAGESLSHLYLSGEVGRIVPQGPAVAGEQLLGTVELAEPAGPSGVDVTLCPPGGACDTQAVAPTAVHVPAWSQSTSFAVRTLAPARDAVLTATTGAGEQQARVFVKGLALSEFCYNPGTDPQWVEITNVSSVAVDLSHYSLGGGSASYAESRAALPAMTLPPGGCLVVRDNAQHSVFQPNPLAPGIAAAGGLALFDAAADADVSMSIPMDAVLYGAANTNNLIDATGTPGLPVPGTPLPGESLERTLRNGYLVWSVQAVPTSGICRVPHAP